MRIYLDLAVLLNFLVDGLLLLGTNRLAGHPPQWRRCALAAAVGAIYGGVCLLPGLRFAAGLFRIGWKYLGFSLDKSGYPLSWQAIYVEELPLLQDILSSGVYGSADRSRQHSSTITLRAVETRQTHAATGVLRSVFPPVSSLEQRYSYLKEKPWLLPVAWTERLVRYGRETRKTANNAPGESIRIGKERLELLRRYGILDK